MLHGSVAEHKAVDVLCSFAGSQHPRQVVDQTTESTSFVGGQITEPRDVALRLGNQISEIRITLVPAMDVARVDEVVFKDDSALG